MSVLFRDSQEGPISAVQDHFGPCYRCLAGIYVAGDIFEMKIMGQKESRRIGEEDSLVCVRILESVHHNTVRALVRRSDYPNRPIAKGRWYSVICD